MNLQDHHLILALIACAALLGVAVGYCIEVLRSSSRESARAQAWDQEKAQLNAAIEKHKASAALVMAAERKNATDARVLYEQAHAQCETLQSHSEVQAREIASLGAELRSTEEQKIKTNLASDLPVLSTRAVSDAVIQTADAPVSERLASRLQSTAVISRTKSKRAAASTEHQLSKWSTTEIPTIAESELSDPIDEFDFASLLASDDERTTSG